MTEHKFTDEEITKALEVCVDNSSCKECPINPNHGNYGYCTNLALTYALDLIKRQKSLIELSEKGLKLGINISENWEQAYRNAKTEAVKEFAERLKERSCFYDHDDSFSFRAVLVEDIDNLVKEMTGEKE